MKEAQDRVTQAQNLGNLEGVESKSLLWPGIDIAKWPDKGLRLQQKAHAFARGGGSSQLPQIVYPRDKS